MVDFGHGEYTNFSYVEFVTAEQLNIIYIPPQPSQPTGMDMFGTVTKMLPKPKLWTAIGKFIPMVKGRDTRPRLEKSMIPPDSSLYDLYKDEENKEEPPV